MTRHKGHCIEGTLSFLMMTIVPSRMLWPPLLHLLRLINSFRYIRCQRFQKCCFSCWIYCHLKSRLDEVSLKSRSRKLIRQSPMGKWPEVRTTTLFGSMEIGASGRELRMDSVSMMRMLKCSNVTNSLPTTRLRWRLNDFTAASHTCRNAGNEGEWNAIQFAHWIGMLVLLLYDRPIVGVYEVLALRYWPQQNLCRCRNGWSSKTFVARWIFKVRRWRRRSWGR